MAAVLLFCGALFIALSVLDWIGKIRLTARPILALFLPLAPHYYLLLHLLGLWLRPLSESRFSRWLLLSLCSMMVLYLLLRLHLWPCHRTGTKRLRLQLLIGGRSLLYDALYGLLWQLPLYFWGVRTLRDISPAIWAIDAVIASLTLLSLLLNGILRILCTSRRLNLIKRLVVIFLLWFPFVNLFVLLYMCHIAQIEYDHECYKVIQQSMTVDSDECKTKYPLMMLHGVGFRDLKYFNYWGRIPRELTRLGASVYYGNQEAWGTIEANAHDIRRNILRVVEETGCKKVNIIAHSKGGLDARYTISILGMQEYVASVTTICSPHHGSRLGDLAARMPDGLYLRIAALINRHFKLLGDKNPDAYNAGHQFTSAFSKQFNKTVRDEPGIYYQSYAAVMKNPLSDLLLSIPYCLMRLAGAGANDGLVEISSAQWGVFRGVFQNRHLRGISHGDAIDLKREDYKGFDIVEQYVKIVSDLKKKGF